MKHIQGATLTWDTDKYPLPESMSDGGEEIPLGSPLRGVLVVQNGSKAVISINSARNRPALRVDQLTDVRFEEQKRRPGSKEALKYTLTGRSVYLRDMGMEPEDQEVSLVIEGGQCRTCT